MRALSLVPGAIALASALTFLLVASPATAQQKGFAVDRFEPSERGSEWFVLDSLDLRGRLRPAVGVVTEWAYHPLVAYDVDGNYVRALIRNQVFLHPGASLVLFDRLRVGASLPIAVLQNGRAIATQTQTYLPPDAAAGDLRLSGDVRLFGVHGGLATGAIGTALHLPTGSRANYTSDGNVRFAPRFTIAGDVSVFTWSARVGYHHRALTERFERNPLGSELTGGAAAGVRVIDRRLVVGPEVFASSILDEDSFGKRRGTSVETLLGAHLSLADFRVGAGAGTGLTRGWGTPAFRGFLSVEWTPRVVTDRDGDGVVDPDDACPSAAGVATRDRTTNGCPALPTVTPPPPDRDGDGVLDPADACPDVVGIATLDAKTSGCPADRDQDGVLDAVDACIDVAGARSEDPKKNGCPPDRDGDGIRDDKDACPDVAGGPSEDSLANGCPADRDADGVADEQDGCPDAPGAGDANPKRNGCPLARVEAGRIELLDPIAFKPGSADILPDSDPTLLATAATLNAHPELAKVRVDGKPDDKGPKNERLGQKRADAVVAALVRYGVDKKRLEAKGLGQAKGPPPTDASRVELHLVTK